MNRAIFLDRDGVINRAIVRDGKPYPPTGLDDLEILPGVEEALLELRSAGYLLIGVTNQPDVARGITSRVVVEGINARLQACLAIDEIRVCYHDTADHCRCRKPEPGMLEDAALEHDIDLNSSYMVGDRWRDIEAGRRAGCRTVFVDYGYNEEQPESVDVRVKSLLDATQIILKP